MLQTHRVADSHVTQHEFGIQNLQPFRFSMTHQTKGFGLNVDAHVDGHIPHQVLVGVEKGVCRRASINKGLPGDQGRDVCTQRPTCCFHNVKTPHCILVPQHTCQIGFGAILGVTEQAFQIRFIGVRIVLLRGQGVVQFDGHLLDHGVQEMFDWDDFLVCEIRSIEFGDLELEFCVTLGQVDVVGGRFNVEHISIFHVWNGGFTENGNIPSSILTEGSGKIRIDGKG